MLLEREYGEGMTTATPATLAWQSERGRLIGIAYRMLGDFGHAEDVVSDVAIEAVQAERGAPSIRSWPAWLTTVCVRRSIDRVRQLAAAREEYPGTWLPEPVATALLPEDAVANRELLSLSLLHLAEQLPPEARAALILSRAFELTAPEIGEVLDKSPAAVRQLISRAERRLRIDPDAAAPRTADRPALERLVTAIANGDLETVMSLFAPDAVLYSDGGGKVRAARNPIYGGANIARFYLGIFAKTAAEHPDAPMQVAVFEVNDAFVIAFDSPGRRDVLEIAYDDAGQVIEVHQISNPDKLTRMPS